MRMRKANDKLFRKKSGQKRKTTAHDCFRLILGLENALAGRAFGGYAFREVHAVAPENRREETKNFRRGIGRLSLRGLHGRRAE